MSRATNSHSTDRFEISVRKRDLGSVVFDDMRLETLQIAGLPWFQMWDVLEALDRYDDDEVFGLLAVVPPEEERLAVLGSLESGQELGRFVSPIGAMRMALACGDVGSQWSGAGRFLRWLAADGPASGAPPAPAPAMRRGHLAVFEGGRAS